MRVGWFWWLIAAAMLFVGTLAMVVLVTADDLWVIDRDLPPASAYLIVFACVFGDAIIPLLPGETVVNAASVLAAQGDLEIGWVIVAGCAGAVLGDNALYWIARRAAHRFQSQVDRLERDERVQTVMRILGDRAPLFIVFGRYVPGVRFFVNASMGIQRYPYRQFLLWSTIGGTVWGVYTALLAYWVGNALSGYPLTSFLLAGAITTALIAIVFVVERRRSANLRTSDAAAKA